MFLKLAFLSQLRQVYWLQTLRLVPWQRHFYQQTYFNVYTQNQYQILIIIIFRMKQAKKLVSLVLILCGIFIAQNLVIYQSSEEVKSQFSQWVIRFGKEYHDEIQFVYRLQIFKDNKKKILQHNNNAKMGKSNYFMGLNRFADYTQKQYQQTYGYFNFKSLQGLSANITTKCLGSISDAPNPPDAVNWTEKAVDKNVIDEKRCAANWAYSAVAAVQGLYSIKMEKFIKFSDQQVIDCSGPYGNQGCGGGFMDQAYWYLIDNGIASQKSYPPIDASQICKYSQSQKIAKLGKCARVPTGNYQKLLSAVVQQPVTVAIASSKFMLYERGIFDSQCQTDIDRGMLLVGYGTQDEQDYWILKNSLGIAWGQKGYIRIKRTHQNGPGWCGIQLAASVPQNVQ